MSGGAETGMRAVVVGVVGERAIATLAEIWAAVVAAGLAGNRAVFRQVIGRMVDGHILRREGYGRYSLAQGHHRRLLSVTRRTEELIAEVLRSHGGIAKTADIHAAIWDRPRGGRQRTYQQQRITKALARSERFSQDYGRGFWNLPLDERRRLPLLGKWAAYEIRAKDARDADIEVQTWFAKVGEAFAQARGDLNVGEIVGDPEIADALVQLAAKAPAARALAMDHAGRDGYELGSSDNRPVLANLYLMFEDGYPALHLAAKAEFYRLCAKRFGVHPTALSRGKVAKTLAE